MHNKCMAHLLVSLVALVALSGWRYGLAAAGEPQNGTVRLTVRIVPKAAFGGTVYAVVTIRNDLAKPVWLNGRLVADPFREHVQLPTRNVWFDIKYQHEGPVRYRCSAGSVPRHFKREDYRLLLPGESVESDQDLSCFDLTRLGHYAVTAHYLDQKNPPPPPKGSVPLTAELVSEPVSFEVMGSRANLRDH